MVKLERHAQLGNDVLVEAAKRVTVPQILILIQFVHEALTKAVRVNFECIFPVEALVVALKKCLDELEARCRLVEIDVVVDTLKVLLFIVEVCDPIAVLSDWASCVCAGCDSAYKG